MFRFYFAITLLILFGLNLITYSQKPSTFDIDNDANLVEINQKLPQGWNMSFDGSTLVIENNTLMHGYREKPLVMDVHPNAAPPLPDTLLKYGIRFVLYNCTEKPGRQQRKKMLRKNKSIDKELKKLPAKYGATESYGKTEFNVIYHFPDSESEEAYEEEKNMLKLQKSQVPMYFSETYSYTSKSSVYFHPDYSWEPTQIKEEADQINQLLQEHISSYK